MVQKQKRQVNIEWSLTNDRQLEFLRACGLSYYFDQLPGATKPVARIILFGGSAGGGKLLSNDGQILTPFGWKLGKDLSVGDLVSNPDGSVQRIIQIKPEVHLPLWRVHFSDGTSTDVAEDHLWYAWRGRGGRKIRNKRTFGEPSGEIIETKELQEWIDRGYNPQIPICKEQPFNVTTKEKNKINPYLIGLLLGDGCLTQSNIEITCAHEDREYYHELFPEYTSVISPKTLRFVGDLNRELKTKLALYGLLGKKSHNKFIPKQYKYSSVADRYALIQGLMDTDGYNDTKYNGCYYTTISKQLAEDVCFVLRSLGAMVTISVKQGRYKKDGEVFECSTVYELYIKHSDKRKLFSLPRKKIGKKIEISKRVTKVEVDGDIKGRCITVSNPNGLYITNDFIVTHNSDAILMAALMGAIAFPRCNIAIFRRSYPNLSGPGGIIMRSQELFPGLGKYHGGDKRWTLFNKSIIEFSHCATDADVYNYKCFRPDTEILTSDGFKNIAEVKVGDMAATMNPETREMEYKPVTETQSYDYDGELVVGKSKNKGVSFAVTPNHTMWAGTVRRPKIRKFRADELPYEAVFPTRCWWNGVKPAPEITFQGIGNHSKTYTFDSRTWAKFLGWYIAEGCVCNNAKNGYRVWLSQTLEDGRIEIKDILDDMGVNYHVPKDKRSFVFASKPICNELDRFGKYAKNKCIPQDVKNWDTEHLELLLDTIVEADGTWVKRGYNGHFVTASKRLADDVMEVSVKCGYRTTVTKRSSGGGLVAKDFGVAYHVCICKKLNDVKTRQIGRKYYKGKVYCVTVPPYHTVLTRHDGKVMWAGQSQQIDFLFIDESTEMTSFQIRYLLTRNRATVAGLKPFCALATNPGGISHGFHKKFFVDAGPPGVPIDVEIEPGRYQKHIFIPSRLSDNKILEDRDPGYRLTLENQPEEIRRALLDGDWDVYAGQYFKNFRRDKHVVEPFKIPSIWRKFCSVDWGYAAPCAVLWHTIEPSSGRVYTYRELYVTEHRAAEVAELVKELSEGEELEYLKMSPDAWHERGLGSKASPGEIIAEEFLKLGLNVEPADNRRIQGWQRMREYLADAPDEKPWWQIFNTCPNLIRTIPEMVHDKRKIEDIDGDCEDHAVESSRYGLMSRPSPVDGSSFMPGAREYYGANEEDDDDFDGVSEIANWYGL